MGILDRFSLRGKTAVVTAGAGPLFGSSISEALAEAGARVITASRSLARNREYAASLAERTGAEVHGMELDIGDVDSITRFHRELLDRHGRVEVLVNSALVRDATAGSFETQTIDAWRRSAAGDMVGLYAICKAFIGSMAAAGGGSIINISSIYGVVGNDPSLYEGTDMVQSPNYNFVKAGMINFTRYLANYHGRAGVRANCISPGGYTAGQPGPFVASYCKRVPLGRMLDNEDLKGAVVFLASDASAYVTGHNLMVDGGFTTL
jgi:NAD(P)-dependent dehydrogenase (short-subunit alcohol dehydrogenase family)